MESRPGIGPGDARFNGSGPSRYHVKGNVYLGTKAFFETKVHGGIASLYAAIADPQLRAFLEQKFLPVAWYDALPSVPLVHAEARAMGLSLKRYLELRSAYQAEKDLAGVYRVVLKLAPTEMVALKLPRLFSQVFDFGSSDAQSVNERHVNGFVRDFPAALYEWFCVSFEVYARTALRLTGVHDPKVIVRKLKSDAPSKDGTELASMILEMRWSEHASQMEPP